ncbi:hypothetical protein [Rhizobium cremeum]|uniref:hypothetical protein n=1 Tax=Rhizobium cremeum TaxID=2813827 RepID=UPI0013B00D5A
MTDRILSAPAIRPAVDGKNTPSEARRKKRGIPGFFIPLLCGSGKKNKKTS